MNFESALGYFPSSGCRNSDSLWANDVDKGNVVGVDRETAGWCLQILSYMEENALASLRDQYGINDGPNGIALSEIPITLLAWMSMTELY